MEDWVQSKISLIVPENSEPVLQKIAKNPTKKGKRKTKEIETATPSKKRKKDRTGIRKEGKRSKNDEFEPSGVFGTNEELGELSREDDDEDDNIVEVTNVSKKKKKEKKRKKERKKTQEAKSNKKINKTTEETTEHPCITDDADVETNSVIDEASGKVRKKKKKNKLDTPPQTLIISNIPYNITRENILQYCTGASAARIAINTATGMSKGLAFVEYKTLKQAQNAIETLDGTKLSGRTIKITLANHQYKEEGKGITKGVTKGDSAGGGKKGDSPEVESNTLLVRNLSYSTTPDKLKELFKYAISARIPCHRDSGNPKGFAFIEFKCRKDANMARNRLKDNCIDGREVSIEFVPPLTLDRYSYGRWESNQNGEPTNTLIVRNLSYFILTEDLNKLFPNAKDVHLPKHLNTGCPKGFAVVEFSSIEEAMKAKEIAETTELMERKMFAGYAIPKGSKDGQMGFKKHLHSQAPKPKKRQKSNVPPPSKCLYLINLPYDINMKQLKRSFKNSVDIRLPMDEKTGKTLGRAFVEFSSIDEAVEAKNNTHHRMGGRRIDMQFSTKQFRKPKVSADQAFIAVEKEDNQPTLKPTTKEMTTDFTEGLV